MSPVKISMPRHTTSNKRYLLPIGILFIAVGLLLLTSVFILTPKIQNNLATQVKEALVNQSIPAEITLSGRDVTLKGKVSSKAEKEKATATTKKICGIRFVDNQLLTEKPENIALIKQQKTSTKPDEKAIPEHIIPSQKSKPQTPDIETAADSDASQSQDTEQQKTPPITVAKTAAVTSTKTAISETTKGPQADTTEATISEQSTEVTKENNKQQSKKKVLDYQTMLAAMQAYQSNQKHSGRNHKDTKILAIQFREGTNDILPVSHDELDQLATKLKQHQQQNIEITVSAANSTLALQRAIAIRDYLVKQDITKKRMQIAGKKGENKVYIKSLTSK